MRTRVLLASLLAIGCGPSEKTNKIPDAEEFPDSPIFVFPDAPPRADARVFDAKMAVPDAKAGTPDAPPPIDAKPATPDAPPPIDAKPATPDAMVTGGLRPWAGTTANVRALDLQLSPGFDTKICIYDGRDANTQPYAVLFSQSHSPVDSYSVSGGYIDTVPSGIPLRMNVKDGSDNTPGDCDSGSTVSLAALTTDEYYTLARTFPIGLDCATLAGDQCKYWPSANGTGGNCPLEGTFLIDDGDFLTFGWRVVNLTSNASNIGYTVVTISDDSWTDLLNLDVDPSAGLSYQAADNTATNLYVCPAYVYWCDAPDKLSDADAISDIDKCTADNPSWVLGTVPASRISDSSKTTTYYIINDARELANDVMSVVGPRVTIVIAADNLSN